MTTCRGFLRHGGCALAGFLFGLVSTCHAIWITTPAFCPSPSLLRSPSLTPITPTGLRRRSTTFLSMTSTQNQEQTNEDQKDPKKNKIVYKRVLYTLSENTDNLKPEHRYSIEDRCQYELNNEKTEEVPVGLRTFIIRGPAPTDDFPPPPPKEQQEELTPEGKKKMPPLPYTRIGPELYRMTVHDTLNGKVHGGLGEHGVKDGIVMALYVMMQPQWMKGKVLELSSGVGMGGLLSVLGAGLALPDDDDSALDDEEEEDEGGEYVSIEDIASKPIPKKDVKEEEEEEENDVLHPNESDHPKAPVPTQLESITLTDESESRLNIALKNCKSSNIKPSKVYLNTMDFAMPVPKEQRNQYTTILGSDLIYSFVDAKRVSKIVAFSLVPSPYDRNIGRQTHIGQFVHVGPKNRDSILDLKKKLREGYLMNVYGTNLNLDVVVLADLVLDNKKEEESKEMELMKENGGYTEYLGKLRPTSYQTLVAEHHEDYDGYNGEWMWPAENGSEENRNARRDIEPDVGYGGYKGGGRGSRRTGVW